MDSPPPSYEEATDALALNSHFKNTLPTALPPRYDEITTAEPETLSIRPQPISPNIQPNSSASYPLNTPRPQTNMVLIREENKECDEKWSWYLVILVIIGLGIVFIYLPNTSFHA